MSQSSSQLLTPDQLDDLWEQDCKISETDLFHESLRTPELRAKYERMLSVWRIKNAAVKAEIAEMTVVRTAYYRGELGKEDLDKYGWEQWQKRTMKGEIGGMLKGDPVLLDLERKLAMTDIMLEKVLNILNEIGKRNFHITNALKWKAFMAGENI